MKPVGSVALLLASLLLVLVTFSPLLWPESASEPNRTTLLDREKPANTPAPHATPASYAAAIEEACARRVVGSYNCPELFILGAQKAATSTVAQYLRRSLPVRFGTAKSGERKEMRLFSDIARGPKRTREQVVELSRNYVESFGLRTEEVVVGLDASPAYLYWAKVPELMASAGLLQEHTRYLVLLRDPVDRFYSALNMMIRAARDQNNTLDGFRFASGMPNGTGPTNIENFALASMDHVKTCRSMTEDNRADHCQHYFQQEGVFQSEFIYRGVYVDQLRSWLRFVRPQQICVLAFNAVTSDARKAITENGRRCLEDLRLKVDDLPLRAKSLNSGSYGVDIDGKYPNLRRTLQTELFDETNRELQQLLNSDWDIREFQF